MSPDKGVLVSFYVSTAVPNYSEYLTRPLFCWDKAYCILTDLLAEEASSYLYWWHSNSKELETQDIPYVLEPRSFWYLLEKPGRLSILLEGIRHQRPGALAGFLRIR